VDLIETNTFNAQAISLADYGMESLAVEMNRAGAACARRAVQRWRRASRAGQLGSGGHRADEPDRLYFPGRQQLGAPGDYVRSTGGGLREQVRALMEGGVDVLLVETIFDTLNAKAAFFAIEQYFDEAGRRVPVMASVTFIQVGNNRTLTGQTVEAFWNSIAHVPLLSVGINCALGPQEMRPLIEELSRIAPIYVSCYPNAGLPDPLLPPASRRPRNARAAAAGLCRGRLAELGGRLLRDHAGPHPRAGRSGARRAAPGSAAVEPFLRLSGLNELTVRPDTNFVNIGERTNVAGSPSSPSTSWPANMRPR